MIHMVQMLFQPHGLVTWGFKYRWAEMSVDKLATVDSFRVDIVLWPDKGCQGNQGWHLPAAPIVHVCACPQSCLAPTTTWIPFRQQLMRARDVYRCKRRGLAWVKVSIYLSIFFLHFFDFFSLVNWVASTVRFYFSHWLLWGIHFLENRLRCQRNAL